MKRYINPKIHIRLFQDESIKTENIVTASADTYKNWTANQADKVVIERKITELREITQFKF